MSKGHAPFPSWRPGHFVWPAGRNKLVVLPGVGSRTGDAPAKFAGLMRYLAASGGYDPKRDLLEASYGGAYVGERWLPRPYLPPDTRRPLFDSAEAVAGALEWYREALPAARFCLVGYSLGGVAVLDGATMVVARDPDGWKGRLAAVVTLASPVRGCNVGPLLNWAWLVTAEPDALGAAGRDLEVRWTDQAERQRVERRARFLRDAGVVLLTLADPDDAVVRPDEALLPAAGQPADQLLVRTDHVIHGSLGHGAILEEPAVWERLLAVLGPQQASAARATVSTPPDRAASAPDDPLEVELQALKARLRREGRLRPQDE